MSRFSREWCTLLLVCNLFPVPNNLTSLACSFKTLWESKDSEHDIGTVASLTEETSSSDNLVNSPDLKDVELMSHGGNQAPDIEITGSA